MERPFWRNEEVLMELLGLNLTELVDFGSHQLLTGSGTTLLCLVHGNVNENEVCVHIIITVGPFPYFLTNADDLADIGNT